MQLVVITWTTSFLYCWALINWCKYEIDQIDKYKLKTAISDAGAMIEEITWEPWTLTDSVSFLNDEWVLDGKNQFCTNERSRAPDLS